MNYHHLHLYSGVDAVTRALASQIDRFNLPEMRVRGRRGVGSTGG